MFSDIVKYQMNPLVKSLKASFAIYSLEFSNDKDITKSIGNLGLLCQKISHAVQSNSISLKSDNYKLFLKTPKTAETEFYSFYPHISVGHSPFMFNIKSGEVVGVYIRMLHSRSLYCTRTIDQLATAYYEQMMLSDTPITHKTAKLKIREDLVQKSNPEDIPIVERATSYNMYLNINNGVLLTKSSKRDQDAMNMFFILMKQVSEDLLKHELIKDAELIKKTFANKFYACEYVNHALRKEKAFGAYNITSLVAHYANQESDEESPSCPVEPTLTADFCSNNDSTQVIKLKNSFDIIFDRSKFSQSSFSVLREFSEDKSLNIINFRATGELPMSEQIIKYCDAFPEALDEEMNGDFIDFTYDTRSKDGNIIFRISEGAKYHVEACYKLTMADLDDHHYPMNKIESVLLDHFGGILPMLHDSSELFIGLYLEANKVSDTFGDKIKQAIK